MQIDLDQSFNSQDFPTLCAQLNQVFGKLFAKLQSQPNFFFQIDPQAPFPTNLAANTIVYQVGANNTLKVGIWDGQNLNITQ